MKYIFFFIFSFSLLVSCSKDAKVVKEKDSINVFLVSKLQANEIIKDLEFYISAEKAKKYSGNIKLNNLEDFTHKDQKAYSRRKTNFPYYYKPIIIDDNIYLTSIKGGVYSYNIKTLTRNWYNPLIKNKKRLNHLQPNIAIYKNMLFYTSGANDLFALDKNTGLIKWQKTFQGAIKSSPHINRGRLFIKSLDGNIYALSYLDGKILWKKEFLGKLANIYGKSDFVIAEDKILIFGTSKGEIKVADSKNGDVIWQEKLYQGEINSEKLNFEDIVSTPVVYKENIYTIANNGYFTSYKLFSGLKNWQLKLSSNKNIWLTNKLIFLIDDDNNLVAVTRKNGKIKWFYDLDKIFVNQEEYENCSFSSPVVIDDNVAVNSNCGKLLTFNYSHGHLLDEIKIPTGVYHSPVIYNKKLFLVSNKSIFYIFF